MVVLKPVDTTKRKKQINTEINNLLFVLSTNVVPKNTIKVKRKALIIL